MSSTYLIYSRMPSIWNHSFRTFPYKDLAIVYCTCFLIMNIANTAYNLAFEDYCNRNSVIYNQYKRNALMLK